MIRAVWTDAGFKHYRRLMSWTDVVTRFSSSPSSILCNQNAWKHFQISVDMIKLCIAYFITSHVQSCIHTTTWMSCFIILTGGSTVTHLKCRMYVIWVINRKVLCTQTNTRGLLMFKDQRHTEGYHIENKKSNGKISETRNYYELHIFSLTITNTGTTYYWCITRWQP